MKIFTALCVGLTFVLVGSEESKGTSCTDDTECKPTEQCNEVCTDPCLDLDCQDANAVCFVEDHKPKCACKSGFKRGEKGCTPASVGTAPGTNKCSDNTQCKSSETCSQGVCSDPCTDLDCQDDNSVCKVENHKPMCLCKFGFKKGKDGCQPAPIADEASFETLDFTSTRHVHSQFDDWYWCYNTYFLGRHKVNVQGGMDDKDFTLQTSICQHYHRDESSYWMHFEYRLYKDGIYLATFRDQHRPCTDANEPMATMIIQKSVSNFKSLMKSYGQRIINSLVIHPDDDIGSFSLYFKKTMYEPKYLDSESVVTAECFKLPFFPVQKETPGGYQEIYKPGIPEPVEKEECAGIFDK